MPAVLTILKTFTCEPIIVDDCTRDHFRSINVLLESTGSRFTGERQDNLVVMNSLLFSQYLGFLVWKVG